MTWHGMYKGKNGKKTEIISQCDNMSHVRELYPISISFARLEHISSAAAAAFAIGLSNDSFTYEQYINLLHISL